MINRTKTILVKILLVSKNLLDNRLLGKTITLILDKQKIIIITFIIFLDPSAMNDSNQKNAIDKDIEKDGLKVEGNVLQVLSDIQEVTEEFSSTLIVRDDGSSESTIGRYQGLFKLVSPQ